ncbi:P-loop containing nucleoside triphosphate hydrolase protein [Aspergillus heterothallicus]
MAKQEKDQKMTLKVAADLDNEKQMRVLGIIDKLRELGIGETVSLPQLVVKVEAGSRITIFSGPSAQVDLEVEERVRSFERNIAADQFGTEAFGKIFDEAAEFMGLPGPNTKNIEKIAKRFSDDFLKIELSGPDQHHLSVVDVRDLFHNTTKYQTAEDRAINRRLIESYMKDKRTIILAVMDARNNLANQEVFSMARMADPFGKRTVGIITKCDAVEDGDEAGEHIRSDFPNVVKDIENHLTRAQISLKLLGPSRHSSIEQRRFLTRAANTYQREVNKALGGNYDTGLERESPLKLRMNTRILSDAFSKAMASRGHARVFQTVRGIPDPEFVCNGEIGKQRPNECIIEWIRAIYRESHGTELPGTVNPAVLENLFRQQTAPWEAIATNYIQKVTNAVKVYNEKVLPTIISRHSCFLNCPLISVS